MAQPRRFQPGAQTVWKWWLGADLNRRRRPFQGRALPTELPSLLIYRNQRYFRGQSEPRQPHRWRTDPGQSPRWECGLMSRRDAIHAELHRHYEFAHRSPNHGLPYRINLTSKPSSRSVGIPNVGNSTAVARPLRTRSERRARSGAPGTACWRCGRTGTNRSIEPARHRTPGDLGDSRLALRPSRFGFP